MNDTIKALETEQALTGKSVSVVFAARGSHAGVSEFEIEFTTGGGHSPAFQHCGWGAALIKVNGVSYLADQVLKALNCDTRTALRYGPGARRGYTRVSESVVQDILNSATYRMARENSRHLEHQAYVAAFGYALIDLISTGAEPTKASERPVSLSALNALAGN